MRRLFDLIIQQLHVHNSKQFYYLKKQHILFYKATNVHHELRYVVIRIIKKKLDVKD